MSKEVPFSICVAIPPSLLLTSLPISDGTEGLVHKEKEVNRRNRRGDLF
jgi:hypothetical protein